MTSLKARVAPLLAAWDQDHAEHVWPIVMDAVEEAGGGLETWERVFEWIAEERYGRGQTTYVAGSWLDVMRGLVATSPTYAEALSAEMFPLADYFLEKSPDLPLRHGESRSNCGTARDLEIDKVEWVIGEQGNLERKPWRVHALTAEGPRANRWSHGHKQNWRQDEVFATTLDRRRDGPITRHPSVLFLDGSPTRRRLWMTHPPEYLERELNRQYDYGSFNTVISDGGGFQSAEPEFLLDTDTFEIWQKIEEQTHSGETACPYADWDPEEHVEEQDRVVTPGDTQCGEYPDEKCRFCEEDVGDPHGYLSIGEGAETVYLLLEEPEAVEED